jgi:DNA-binding transcriptional MerR regulator/methylmalonyl-CoA mutase cobalamin-binding subunit
LTTTRSLPYYGSVTRKTVPLYPIRAVAKLTGLSIDTLRAWERRYQAVTPLRAERGRVYTEAHVRRLSLLRDAVERGHSIGQVASLEDAKLEELLAISGQVGAPAPASASRTNGGTVPAFGDVVAAIEAFDYAAVNTQLGRLAVLLPAGELIHRVVLPLMELVGERWHSGAMSIAQEHMTSAILRNLLGALVRLYEPSEPPVRLLFATPSGELHEFGILAAAMLAAARGFGVLYLGPNLPASDIVAAAERTSPQAVVLGIKASKPGPETTEAVKAVAHELPEGTELWVGGDARSVLQEARGAGVIALKDFGEFGKRLGRLRSR